MQNDLSAMVVALRIVGADGEVVRADASVRPGLFQAGRLSLGAFGIVTAVTFQCVPAYNLHERVWFEECVGGTSRRELGLVQSPEESFRLSDDDTVA